MPSPGQLAGTSYILPQFSTPAIPIQDGILSVLASKSKDNAACIRIEAHLVENLKAKLLIGMDIMGHEGFRLDMINGLGYS
jgi:hypothetical protein